MKDTFATKHTIALTPRDIEIFKLIQSEGAKTSADLQRRFWNGKSRKAKAAFQRIRKLIDIGLLERGNPKLLHLSDEGRKLLKSGLGVGEETHHA